MKGSKLETVRSNIDRRLNSRYYYRVTSERRLVNINHLSLSLGPFPPTHPLPRTQKRGGGGGGGEESLRDLFLKRLHTPSPPEKSSRFPYLGFDFRSLLFTHTGPPPLLLPSSHLANPLPASPSQLFSVLALILTSLSL